MRTRRIGAMLVERGLLTDPQVQQVLDQQLYDPRPFVTIAAEVFGLDEEACWTACAAAILPECPETHLHTERFDPSLMQLVPAREAWAHLVLPLRMERGELVCATTEGTLGNAIALLHRKTTTPFRFVIAESRPLEQFIAERYAYEGVEVLED